MVEKGSQNSRVKDCYDVWFLSKASLLDDERLSTAIAATFERRKTAVPDTLPEALTKQFARDEKRRHQWQSFMNDALDDPLPLTRVIDEVADFLMPRALRAIELRRGEGK